MKTVLSQKQNRYLGSHLCWMMTIESMETYLLIPRNETDFDLLIEALSPVPQDIEASVVIGVRGPMATPDMCNGLLLPIIFFDQIYSFPVDNLIKAIPRPEKIAQKEFTEAARVLFDRISQMSDNAGAMDEHRALNYLAVPYDRIYSLAAEMYGRDFSLSAIEVRLSSLSGPRKVVEVIFSFTNRNSDVIEKFFVRVDVTERWPFLVSKMVLF